MLELSYILLSLAMAVLLILAYRSGIRKIYSDGRIRSKKVMTMSLTLFGWLAYISLLGSTDILKDFSFPPRFVVFMILPAFVFTGIYNARMHKSDLYKVIPESWPVFYQTFRILIETIFVYTVTAGILHEEVTVNGYNKDMIYAMTAPVIGLLVFVLHKLPRWVALVWNYVGLAVIAVIIFIFITSVYTPELWGYDQNMVPTDFAVFPYMLVPGFLMPSAVFIHVFSIMQLSKKNDVLT